MSTNEVENLVNGYLVGLFKNEIRMAQLLDLLERHKKDGPVLFCLVHSLFDEYKYLLRYPEKERAIVAVLLGQLINVNLIDSKLLPQALNLVLDALNHNTDNPYFVFATIAIQQFQFRLNEWPQYVSLILSTPNLQRNLPDLFAFLSNDSVSPIVFTALKPDPISNTLLFTPPQDNIRDKMLFLINNLSSTTLDSKLSEMKTIFKQDYSSWLSGYIVSKRVAIEPNYHSLYNDFIDGLTSKVLDSLILSETFENIKVILNSNKTVKSSEDRGVLKNLGMWLGTITLAKYYYINSEINPSGIETCRLKISCWKVLTTVD